MSRDTAHSPIRIVDERNPARQSFQGLIVGQSLIMPEDREGAVARGLRCALARRGPRRRRGHRYGGARGGRRGDTRHHRLTPELDALLAHPIATLPPDDENEPSYFASGRVSAAAVEKLLAAGRLLFALPPWTVADDTQVLRIEIEESARGALLHVLHVLEQQVDRRPF